VLEVNQRTHENIPERPGDPVLPGDVGRLEEGGGPRPVADDHGGRQPGLDHPAGRPAPVRERDVQRRDGVLVSRNVAGTEPNASAPELVVYVREVLTGDGWSAQRVKEGASAGEGREITVKVSAWGASHAGVGTLLLIASNPGTGTYSPSSRTWSSGTRARW
jgi:hypothetical protein